MIGINRKSTYVKTGLNNRQQYEDFIKREGPIVVGETVSCMALLEAIVNTIASDRYITLKPLPFGTSKRFKSVSAGKIGRHKPCLDTYECATRFDTTPQHAKRTIKDFYRFHAHMSPNKNDELKQLHPLYPA